MINSQYKPCFDLIKTYGTFLSSHNNGKCNKISKGSASAAQTMNSEIPLFNVLVAENHNRQLAYYQVEILIKILTFICSFT